jgi:hypothetical protein
MNMSSAAVTEKSEIKALRLHGTVFCRTTSAGQKAVQRPESGFPDVPTWVSLPKIIHTRPSARLERPLLKSIVVGPTLAPTFMNFTGNIEDISMAHRCAAAPTTRLSNALSANTACEYSIL